MTLNKTKIEWTDYTWNPVTGCKHGCDYCYARRIAERLKGSKAWWNGFEPTFHPDRLNDLWRVVGSKKILVCSMADLFGSWVPRAWIDLVLEAIRTRVDYDLYVQTRHPDLRKTSLVFQFLTKNPKRYGEFDFPSNCWLGTTVDRWQSWNLKDLADTPNKNLKFVSFEPLLSEMCHLALDHHASETDWAIVGAQTGPGAKPPKKEWVEEIIGTARAHGIPLFLKDNLHWPEKIQEYPKAKGGQS